MTLQLSPSPWKLVILVFILLAVLFFAYVAWQFDQSARRSEGHHYYYSIDLSSTTTIDNVTLFLPVPELNNTPMLITSLLDGTAYGVPPDWDLSVVSENGTPMLAIRAARMVPEYHGYPVAIEPGTTVLITTLVPGHEYTRDTPVLVPVTIAVMESSESKIDTRSPFGHEPLFFPDGIFTPSSCIAPLCNGLMYNHLVPVYFSYTSESPVVISLRVSVSGSNSIWRGGWQSNTYTDSVFLEITNTTRGWIDGKAELVTGEGVYY